MYKRQVEVPGTLSLSGFDDIFVAQVVSPPLTSVNHNYGLLARAALDALLEGMTGPAADGMGHDLAGTPRQVDIPTEIVERASIRTVTRRV